MNASTNAPAMEILQVTVNLAPEYSKEKAGHTVTVPGHIAARVAQELVSFGIMEKINNALAGVTDPTEMDRLVSAMCDAWKAGEWSTRGAGDGHAVTLTVVGFWASLEPNADLKARFASLSARKKKDAKRSPRDLAKIEWAEANPEEFARAKAAKATYDARIAAIKADIDF